MGTVISHEVFFYSCITSTTLNTSLHVTSKIIGPFILFSKKNEKGIDCPESTTKTYYNTNKYLSIHVHVPANYPYFWIGTLPILTKTERKKQHFYHVSLFCKFCLPSVSKKSWHFWIFCQIKNVKHFWD